MTHLVVLGATGSIGRQTLEVADRLGRPVVALAAGSPSGELAALAVARPEALVVVAADSDDARDFARLVPNEVRTGPDAVAEAAAIPDSIVVNGIVGAAGLAPSVAALESGNRLALANKESLVAGGPVVTAARDTGGGELIPVDSEHSAIWQVLVGEDRRRVRRIILTASGGPFRGRVEADLATKGPEATLDHPTWSMGPRITVDSATLMNKAFEVIEAHFLFDVAYDDIDVVVHPQSIVHSFVEFVDGAVTAELGLPDMRIPIQYAITYPDREPAPVSPLRLAGVDLSFEDPDRGTFRALDLGYAAGRSGGSAPAVLNAADEVAVAAFLEKRIGFLDIASIVERTLDAVPWREVTTVPDVLAADADARAAAGSLVAATMGIPL